MSQYNNTLDSWYQSTPWPVQKVLEMPYTKISEGLRWVTGDPNKVAGYGPLYENVSRQIERIAGEVATTSSGIQMWEGQARQAFDKKMAKLEESLRSLAPAIARTREILEAAAETSVEAANMILDIVRSVIEFLLSSLAISAALAVFTFGASFGAWIAANLAKGAHALSKVMQGLARVAKVLAKIAEMLEKIARILRKLAEILKLIKEILDLLKAAKKGASLIEKGIYAAIGAIVKMPIKLAAGPLLDGASRATGIPGLSMPGGLGELGNAAQDGADAVEASNRAVRAAGR